jgi:CDP-glucose 4,6-dehydratase
MITSDKCYENHEWEHGYHEEDQLGGHDLYSASKAAAELLVSSYRRSFLAGSGMAVASARAGNVIGGGDWSPDRIVPDAIRALAGGEIVEVRNAAAVRPWQHVLEPLSGYLHLGAALLATPDPALCAPLNFGPAIHNTRTVGELVAGVVREWGSGEWRDAPGQDAPHEATLLRLDIRKAERDLGWTPRWDFDEAVARTVDWYKAHHGGEAMAEWCRRQIADYERAPVPAAPRV